MRAPACGRHFGFDTVPVQHVAGRCFCDAVKLLPGDEAVARQ